MKSLHTTLVCLFMAMVTFNINAQDIAATDNPIITESAQVEKKIKQLDGFLEAANVCSKQIMLVNRISKDYMIIGSNSRMAEEAITEMRTSISDFETQLEQLIEYAPSSELKIDLQKMNFSWIFFKKLIFKKKSKQNALSVLTYSERFSQEIEFTLELVQNIAGKSSLRKVTSIIGLAGQQRVLSQRIPMYYVAHKWGVKGKNIVAKFDETVKSFKNNLKSLQENPMNSKGSSLYLNGLATQFDYEKKGYKIPSELSVTEIFLFTNEIESKMEVVTGLYTKIPSK